MDTSKIRKKRNPNWDAVEKALLKKCLSNWLDIIENKCTDTNTNKLKHVTWQKILQSFNEINERHRSILDIKQQWRTMKIDAKKCNSKYKKALKATGGGPKPPSPDPATKEILELLPLEFEEDTNIFDSDTITQKYEEDKENQECAQNIDHYVIEICDDDKNKNNLYQKDSQIPDVGSCDNEVPITLDTRTPIKKRKFDAHNPLPAKIRKNNPIDVESRMADINKTRNETILEFMRVEHEIKVKHMMEAQEWARKEHELKIKNLKLQNKLIIKQLKQ